MDIILKIVAGSVALLYLAGMTVLLSECRKKFPTWPYANWFYQLLTFWPAGIMRMVGK